MSNEPRRISPEDQKKNQERERKAANDRLVRGLRKGK